MALGVFFRKTSETDTHVHYEVIGDPAEPALSIVIEKVAAICPQESFETRLQATAYRMIMAKHEQTGTWIEHGHKQS